MLGGLLVAMRPKQWTKNGLIFGGLIFAFKLGDADAVAVSVAAFALFCLVSSATYLINDLADLERDRKHPIKKRRPIAAGILRPAHVVVVAGLLLVLGLPLSFLLNPGYGFTVLAYVFLTLAYSAYLKHLVIIDVFTIAAGFVLRAMAGALAIAVPISPWLYVCTILGALFLGFTKRRHELLLLNDDAAKHRRILQEYSPELLDQMITIVTATTVIAYSLYTFSAENLPRNHAMMLTIPFVLYGIFRYLYLVHQRDAGGSPEEVLLRDRPLLADIALWGLTSIAVLYLFRG